MTQLVTQGMPRIDTPLINPDGTMNYIWYNFFLSIWKMSGLATPGVGVNQYITDPAWIPPVFAVDAVGTPVVVILNRLTGQFEGFFSYTP